MERKLYYTVYVYPPENVVDNENVTLHFKVEKVSMTGLSGDSKDLVKMDVMGDLDADQTTAYTNLTPPVKYRDMYLRRVVSSEDVVTQKLDVMPGFRLSWWYTGAEVTPDSNYKEKEMTKQFVRCKIISNLN